jgi:DNA-binding HxlR family transcriptional regulator
MGEPPGRPELREGVSRDRARELRASLDREERDRAERTLADLFDLLGSAHALAVLQQFATAGGSLRFGDIEDDLDIAPNTLSARLSDLTDAGLLDREAYDENPPRVEYRPTDAAEELFPVFDHLHAWAATHEL